MTDEKGAQRGEQREAEERREAGRQTEAGDEFTQQRPLVEELLALDHTCQQASSSTRSHSCDYPLTQNNITSDFKVAMQLTTYIWPFT